jgi:hypothetical protein
MRTLRSLVQRLKNCEPEEFPTLKMFVASLGKEIKEETTGLNIQDGVRRSLILAGDLFNGID